MPKRRKTRKSKVIRRDAMQPSSLTVRLSRVPVKVARFDRTLVEDRRRYHPLKKFQAARTFSGRAAAGFKVSGRDSRKNHVVPAGLRFAVPERVLICNRRKERREVIFATGKVGRGRRKQPRRTPFSEISCKR